MKRGLVLEGGGALGAYQIGCLKAFRDRGVRFDAVSGSSVGGLHAAVWSAGRIEEAENLWATMRPGRILSRRPWLWLRTVGIALGYLLASSFILVIAVLGPASCVAVLTANPGVFELMMRIPGGPATLTFGSMLLSFLGIVLLRALGSLFDSGSLAKEIASILEGSELRVPTYVTVAHNELVFDPDRPGQMTDKGFSGATSTLVAVPTFVRLDEVEPEDRGKYLLAGSAVPVLFSPIETKEGVREDALFVDNRPCYPLISVERCEELFVVCLKPHRSRDSQIRDAEERDRYRETNRTARVVALGLEACEKLYTGGNDSPMALQYRRNDPPKFVPYEDPKHWPERFLYIVPSRALGRRRVPELDYSAAAAMNLMRQGYQDAMSALDSWVAANLDQARSF